MQLFQFKQYRITRKEQDQQRESITPVVPLVNFTYSTQFKYSLNSYSKLQIWMIKHIY